VTASGEPVSPPLILCSARLGTIGLAEKFAASAVAGFDGVSVYGNEVQTAIDAGVDLSTTRGAAGIWAAEVDATVRSVRSLEGLDDGLRYARLLGARSITVVETGDYDPTDRRQVDAAKIVAGADRPNGGLLFDLWHHLRGPDGGQFDPSIDPSMIFEIQVADMGADAWPNVRDECMTSRLLPGEGHGQLARRVAALVAMLVRPAGASTVDT
jgi:sugar phosphate isomerase/epimerase